MTGYGSRFVAAGYQELKPFIKVQGKSILQWILDGMYPGESNILFVCRQEHLEKIPGMKKALLEISPSAEVYAIDKTKARHSPGVYYFRTGELLKRYCQRLVDSGKALNGEYYASLPYNFMVQDGLQVWAPANVEQFCQWGTPEDLKEYLFWTDMVRRFDKR